ncbi:SRPBCC family protein [Nocardioides sp.]|uniref:SRPBCC family protein n=1 Tax=Nocardioides sp. TaxID=35761 RepID=UPI002B272520|nr:SRPBCC family protein [Nocardioides sp.]
MGTFLVSRSTSVDADPALVHAFVNNFHEWKAWSPWEDVDPDMERIYSGAPSGVGAHYAWLGDRKAGQGTMEIVASSPERIEVALSFVKPFKASNDVVFRIEPGNGGTEVTWEMSGEQKGLMALVGKVYSMDRLVGKDFERGLARLKVAAEA